MSKADTSLNVLVFKEGDFWIAQCLDYDLAAHAKDLSELPARFFRMIGEHIILSFEYGKKPFVGLRKPPAKFANLRKQFQKGGKLPLREKPNEISVPRKDYIAPYLPPVDMRVHAG